MFEGDVLLMVAAFAVVTSLFLFVALLYGNRGAEMESRLADLPGPGPRKTNASNSSSSSRSPLPRMGEVLMPEDESKISKLTTRMKQAGLYRRHAKAVYLGVKFLLMVVPMLVGLALSTLGLMTIAEGVLFGAMVGLIGNFAPSLWIRRLKSERQKSIRRALPDALDIMVVCLEGGLSLSGALARVTSELKNAHPLLADEMAIVRREIQLGRTTGEALRQFADRLDLEELRSLASVIIQTERFGASIVKALRVHADTLRMKRYQYAEAQAQKAPVKLIFPTVLCIFPALYIVLMGPAGVQLLEMFENLNY